MKRVLVTGGTGFIGSRLVEELLRRGYNVFVISRQPEEAFVRKESCLRFMKADITDYSSLRRLPDEYDYVFHLAAVRDSLHERKCHETNVLGTKNLLAWLSQCRTRPKKIIHVSSLGACGLSNEGRARKEDDAMNPCSIYGRAKMLAEKTVEDFGSILPYIIVRPCKVYGPGDMKILFHFRLAKYGVMPAIGSEPRCLSLCYVDDLRHFMIALAESDKVNEKYFASDRQEYSWEDLYMVMADIMHKKLRKITIPEGFLLASLPMLREVSRFFPSAIRPEATTFEELKWRRWVCDSGKLYAAFPDFVPTTLKPGLLTTAEWFRLKNFL